MAYNTGNPIGSTSPKDLSDNAQNLDLLMLGDKPAYPDRKGVPRKSWKGMEAEYVSGQLRRATEFHAAQVDRHTQFIRFLESSGYEAPVPYEPGLILERPTQTVTYLGNEYRIKSQFLPLTTTEWAVDDSKLKLIGDDSLRQQLNDISDPLKNVAMLGVSETGETLDKSLSRIFPAIILDHATTSWAKIKSAEYTDDQAADLANLLDMKKSVGIDTQIALNNTVLVSKARARLYFSPGGILLNGPAMAQKSMLKVTGHHAMVVEPNMDNPAMLKSATGPRQTGIDIQADHCTVRDGTFRRMLHAISTAANGEWYMPVYFNNVAYDCLGVGAGAADTGANGYGEDRGDAFLIWGATGMMINNRAFCMEGQDARIAFHCEALGKAYLTRPYNPKRDGYDYIVSGNYAYGNFRRHFVFEAVRRGLMNNNISAGGATWWPVSITGGADLSIRNMHLYYDRPATNSAGIAWSPDRGGIMVGQGGKNIQLSDITIVFSPDAVGAGLTSLISAVPSTGVTLDRIRIIKPIGQGGLGFVADKLSDFKMTDCHVQGASIGLTTYGNQDCWIKDFSAYDIAEDAIRVTGGGGSTVAHVRIEGGRLERVVNGVVATNLDSLSVRGTQFKDVSRYDIEQFGTRGAITIDGCHNENGTGKLAGLNAPFKLMEVRNIGDNPGFVYNLKYEIACITNATSALNIFGKHTGKTVIGYDGLAYISTGSAPVAPWAKVSTLTTPA